MSWMQKLSETYDKCQSLVGYSSDESKRPLLPICHITAQAHVEIVIDQNGNFRRARVVLERTGATTIIPCTEASGSRSGKRPECHPLCDKLQYVAGDFTEYGGIVTSGYSSDPGEPYRNYVKTLTVWCESRFAHPKAQAILRYVKKKSVIKDLVEHRVLFAGNDGKLLAKSERPKDKNISSIFSVIGPQEQYDAFIRWQIEVPGEPDTRVWKDKTLWKSWINYYFNTKQKEPLCYVKGQPDFLSSQHPKFLRARGDGAKIISSNDTSGFTFRGRFITAEQACGVSYEVSQKAHNALIWLIDRQGKVFFVKADGGRKEPGLTVVAWAASDRRIPQPTEDPYDILGGDLPSDESLSASTAQELAIKFRNKMLGYKAELGDTRGVQVMALDSASKGRLAIIYYQELTASDYLDRINRWHQECSWIHRYRYRETQDSERNTVRRKHYAFVGAPALKDIAEVAYGAKVDDRLKIATIQRILPCIIDGQQLPRDLVGSALRRASNRAGKEGWEWEKTLSIACALFKKLKNKENYDMALETTRKTRDYLYGRLLAIADRLEGHALYKAKEKRETNAARFMQQFAERPNKTWRQIYLSLTPYMARLGGAKYYKDMIDEVMCNFDSIDEFNSDKPLSGEFLIGYHCQRAAMWQKPQDEFSGEEPDTTQ